MKKDLYASEEDTKALLRSDTRTAAQKKLDALLEKRHAFEMGNEPYQVLYQIATELIEGKREAVELAFEAGRQQGIKQERALWELAKIGQEIEAMPQKDAP